MAKMTKVQAFTTLIDILDGTEVSEEVNQTLRDFLTAQIEYAENKAEKAKERKANKPVEPDELLDVVKSLLTDELQTAAQIAEQIVVDGEPVSRAKVSARLTKLAKAGVAEKGEVVVEETGKKYAAYKIV